ncbi:hypothetical protein XENTR_v10018920 [Xenopus tropicalis]|uniref:Fibronectin type III domain containing 10 n=1 Tax=Xenopus tropicalis TaxID=8364 RepID=A0A803K9H8_XENTR|nr:fibronectin type III domain-containing protein 10 [Xenopus tropicalis]KAE8592942.1 hypothetical protein XENTR_v10018920 [Xenopus tropicalis]|eukprot:XP_004916206.1 PREDICTED: fibronectin type-III domain-containing transmembrane protein C1orf233 homolog [Xenopus tropicalis]
MISCQVRTVRSLLLLAVLDLGSLTVVTMQKAGGGKAWRVSPHSPAIQPPVTEGTEWETAEPPTPGANTSGHDGQGQEQVPSDIICPYKVITEGPAKSSNICFRTTDSSFHCAQSNCKVFRSDGSLLANVLSNSSVLLQWRPPQPQPLSLRGFLINCSWNGTFTRFQCDSVHLGTNCRDYLLTNVHDNVKYRICLKTLYTNRTSGEECVEFTVEPVGMQDIVIAMTAVGGSICVMLVIICLLVAYITENLMHPAFTHPSGKRGP